MARDNYSSRDPYSRNNKQNYIQWWLLEPKQAVPWDDIIKYSKEESDEDTPDEDK